MPRRDKDQQQPEGYEDRVRYCVDRSPVSEVVELRAQNESLRRALLGPSTRAPLRPAFRTPVLMHAIPDLAAQFHGQVPADRWILPPRGPGLVELLCRCDRVVLVRDGQLEGCDCGRWFTRLGDVVRVARPPEPPAEES